MAEFDALTRAERDRLERFAAAFEQLDPRDYEPFAGTTAPDGEIEAARATALRAIGSGSRRAAVERAIEAFGYAADRALAERAFDPLLMYGGTARSPRVEDRARLRQSLERAVVGVILWDELDDLEREALLGPWAGLAARAIAEPR